MLTELGKYEIIKELGAGGMGTVYHGRDRMLQREVAVKVIQARDADSESKQRFYREARACARLSHPNIVTVFDLGEHEDVTYIAMEYLEGEDLRKFVDQERLMSMEGKIQFMAEVCDGLAHAHENGIVHRDIKPGNIFILRSGKPKILDFGIARVWTSRLTQAGSALGTAEYMAPEHLRGKTADARSDIFSTAVVFYEFLTGVHPFAGSDVARRIANDAPTALRILDPTIPPRLEDVIAKAISKEPADRYQTAAEFAKSLRKVSVDLLHLSAALMNEALELRARIVEYESLLADILASDQGQVGLAENQIDLEMVSRISTQVTATTTSDLHYLYLIELKEQFVRILDYLHDLAQKSGRIGAGAEGEREGQAGRVQDTTSPQSAPRPADEISASSSARPSNDSSVTGSSTSTRSAAGNRSDCERRLGALAQAVQVGDTKLILKVLDELEVARSYFDPTDDAALLERIETECRTARDAAVELAHVTIRQAISRSDPQKAREGLRQIEEVCLRDPHYTQIADTARREVNELVKRTERAAARPKLLTKSEGRLGAPTETNMRPCPGCGVMNSSDAEQCHACSMRMPPRTRHLRTGTPTSGSLGKTRSQAGLTTARGHRGRVAAVIIIGVLLLAGGITFILLKSRGEAHVRMGTAYVLSDSTTLRTQPSESAPSAGLLNKNAAVDLIDTFPVELEGWVKVLDVSSPSTTRYLRLREIGNTSSADLNFRYANMLLEARSPQIAEERENLGRAEELVRPYLNQASDQILIKLSDKHISTAERLLPDDAGANAELSAARYYLSRIPNTASNKDALSQMQDRVQRISSVIASGAKPKPAPSDPRLLDNARQAFERGDYGEAISIYDKMLLANPKDRILLDARQKVLKAKAKEDELAKKAL